jgi:hypothetical protein
LQGNLTALGNHALVLRLKKPSALSRYRSAGRWSGRHFKSFDLFFDFVGESCRAGAVYDAVIKCE